jgi:hypothetical protein
MIITRKDCFHSLVSVSLKVDEIKRSILSNGHRQLFCSGRDNEYVLVSSGNFET